MIVYQCRKAPFRHASSISCLSAARASRSLSLASEAGPNAMRNLQELARLIKADAGIETAFAEIDGWDHHQNENNRPDC